jgi:mutator protein MutT
MKHTTLLFLRQNGNILLAMKKRGFGAGKWNGTGGKVEEGETYMQAAIRECQEEVGVTPQSLRLVGELDFQVLPDTHYYCHTHVATAWEGEPHETEEMSPRWFAEADIPYGTMWPDDKLWLPLLLDGKLFKGSITIEANAVRYQDVHEVDAL